MYLAATDAPKIPRIVDLQSRLIRPRMDPRKPKIAARGEKLHANTLGIHRNTLKRPDFKRTSVKQATNAEK
jgi:hypothetical protein